MLSLTSTLSKALVDEASAEKTEIALLLAAGSNERKEEMALLLLLSSER